MTTLLNAEHLCAASCNGDDLSQSNSQCTNQMLLQCTDSIFTPKSTELSFHLGKLVNWSWGRGTTVLWKQQRQSVHSSIGKTWVPMRSETVGKFQPVKSEHIPTCNSTHNGKQLWGCRTAWLTLCCTKKLKFATDTHCSTVVNHVILSFAVHVTGLAASRQHSRPTESIAKQEASSWWTCLKQVWEKSPQWSNQLVVRDCTSQRFKVFNNQQV